MTLVIGTDEAGYGPNLGPLVIAATAWRIDAEPDAVETRLATAIESAATGLWGDSKKIYRAGAGLEALERGVLVGMALASRGLTPSSWAALMEALGETSCTDLPENPALERLTIPRHQHAPSCTDRSIAIGEALAAFGIRLEAMRTRIIQPAAFNAMLDRGLNKSDILSQATLDLASSLATRAAPGEPRLVWCDRHGGRRRYAPLVTRAFDLSLVRPLEETAGRSAYELPPGGRIEFTVGGESRIPVALASMTAKYLRELSMAAFNTEWCERASGLEPTAGYPADALRWRRDAAAAIEAAGIPSDMIWRRA
jgi:hypothetical protein